VITGSVITADESRAEVDNALCTTRAIRRRLDLDRSVDHTLIHEALTVAAQAPSGGASEPVRWLVVTDAATRLAVGRTYREAYMELDQSRAAPSGESAGQVTRVRDSSRYLAEVMGRVPVQVVVCTTEAAPICSTGPEAAKFYGSVYPATWSFQVALRTRGLGSCLTTIGLRRQDLIAEVLGIPAGWTQCALLPVAHIVGSDLSAARRRPLEQVVTWV
jgi:nitroreductase